MPLSCKKTKDYKKFHLNKEPSKIKMRQFVLRKLLMFSMSSILASICFLLCKIVMILRIGRIERKIIENFKTISSLRNEEDFMDSLLSFAMYKTILKQIWIDCFRTLAIGSCIPDDLVVYGLSSKQAIEPANDEGRQKLEISNDLFEDMMSSLKDLCSDKLPLVLNFGSCS